jgi:lactoylglutathione lyase
MKKRFIVALILISFSPTLMAQQGSETVYLNHIALLVKDLKKSTDFYETILHLKQIPEPFKDGLHTWFTLGQAGQIHLIQNADTVSLRNKHDHVCFSVKSIDEIVAILNQNHVPYVNWAGSPQTITTRVDGVKQVFFQDPDGHYIEVNDDYPEGK